MGRETGMEGKEGGINGNKGNHMTYSALEGKKINVSISLALSLYHPLTCSLSIYKSSIYYALP